jgi:hypothetical protein
MKGERWNQLGVYASFNFWVKIEPAGLKSRNPETKQFWELYKIVRTL